ncbi:formimidoylglutamate deiminase [Fulvivirga sedimenti]|uniref:Formimidoylglutamate deiminase n=1 Tax=Fulvivirga sedimenti TaxID=2879465 RepID=A0A9X1L0X7_9BACT|nr:formimidoylglutamate deiminase [Fulvivirga sedimenti]MCA6075159.1 formimidoylglutamate deiminase [Fulvivirga sedimenti]MCA6076336.1 formimidoylglutamate deiminase [Fulvivirga sedimenti]MCA6077464.1 formimidoylglutamate deiminase [Fulvivirga sedimenti]
MKYQFKALLTNHGWMENATITVDENGLIKSIATDEDKESNEGVNGLALPGFQNAHSHAFQYAMAGLAEVHPHHKSADDFWSWRNTMYEIALSISPDTLFEVALLLYRQMLRHGYTSVAEFHYLHHDPTGEPYSNLAEMGERLAAAAGQAGIKITLIPMFYQRGGFGKPAEKNQRRFISRDLDTYMKLLDASRSVIKQYAGATLGMGVHSLRAVDGDLIRECFQLRQNGIPFHIHIAEQLKEVSECEAFYGRRPVEWFLESCQPDHTTHLVHATHLTESEVWGIAASGANVVLCPSTEANLGDGLFRFHDFKMAGGKWSIGTDSHIGLNPFEELRMLDYGQRLISHRRNTFTLEDKADSGFNAIEMSISAGRLAMGRTDHQFFDIGMPFDAVVIDADSPLLAGSSPEQWCSTLIYTGDVSDVLGTIVNGQWKYHRESHDAFPKTVQTFLNLRKR